MKFQPVHLDQPLNDRGSMTFLRHANLCMRSGYLYAQFKGEASTHEMQRGRALHAILERSIRACVEQGETVIPPELVKAIAAEVLAEEHVPLEEHDAIREMAYRFGSQFAVDPSAVVALETLFVLDVDGFEVRCRIDLAELLEGGAAVAVHDWKSSRGAPTFEDISRARPDGSRMGKNAQLVMYALALAFGVPVREEDGQEIREPFPVASRAQRFDLEFVFPAIEDREGRMVRRPVSLTRLELEEYRDSLRGLVARVREAERTGDWPAMVSDEGCSICPAASLCPIPAELRDHRGTINSDEQAAEALALLDRERAEHRARQAELRNYVKARGGELRFDGKVAVLEYSESETVTDRESMFAAMERAVQFGEPFDRAAFVKVRGSTRFVTRDVAPDEVAEERVTASTGYGRDYGA